MQVKIMKRLLISAMVLFLAVFDTIDSIRGFLRQLSNRHSASYGLSCAYILIAFSMPNCSEQYGIK